MKINAYYAAFIPEKDSKFSVIFPDIGGCTTWGESREHAYVMATEALEGHLEAMVDDNDELPEPSNYTDAWTKAKAFFEDDKEPMPEDMTLQLIPASDLTEKPRRINISLRPSTISMIKRKADTLGMTQSGFLAKAAERFQI